MHIIWEKAVCIPARFSELDAQHDADVPCCTLLPNLPHTQVLHDVR